VASERVVTIPPVVTMADRTKSITLWVTGDRHDTMLWAASEVMKKTVRPGRISVELPPTLRSPMSAANTTIPTNGTA